jgi:hypothetical protein
MKTWKENSRLPFRATEPPAKRFCAVLGWARLVVGVVVGPVWVAIPMLLGRTSFLPPFISWYRAMLFAIVPLRNFLPGNPPLGSWIRPSRGGIGTDRRGSAQVMASTALETRA